VATVVGSTVITSPIDAALINGLLAHSDETDDSHGESQSHPGASVVPAALAAGESLQISGCSSFAPWRSAMTSASRDDGARWVDVPDDTRAARTALRERSASAAGRRLRRIARRDADALAARLRVAGVIGIPIWERDTDHIEKGFVFAGMPARNGVTAALLVHSGFNGVDDVFSERITTSR